MAWKDLTPGISVSYNAFNKPVWINKNSITSTFAYGSDQMRYKQVKTGNTGGAETTHYLGKDYEVLTKNGEVTKKTYLGSIAVITEKQGGANAGAKIGFIHRDRLGSVVTVTDENGNLVDNKSYDPFGKPRTGTFDTLAPMDITSLATIAQSEGYELSTNRGFTDHEHLDDAELIHMNGRIYDYNLGRFLSVDPVIKSPTNSQSMNPYSYIMNNPLAGTDPSGYSDNADVGKEAEFEQEFVVTVKTGMKTTSKVTVTVKGSGNKFTVSSSGGTKSINSSVNSKVKGALTGLADKINSSSATPNVGDAGGSPVSVGQSTNVDSVSSFNENEHDGKGARASQKGTYDLSKAKGFSKDGIKYLVVDNGEDEAGKTEAIDHMQNILKDPSEGTRLLESMREEGVSQVLIFRNTGITNDKKDLNFAFDIAKGTLGIAFDTRENVTVKSTRKNVDFQSSWQRRLTHEFVHVAYNLRGRPSEKRTIRETNKFKGIWSGQYDRDPSSHNY